LTNSRRRVRREVADIEHRPQLTESAYGLISKFAIVCGCAYGEDNMDTTTLLIIIIVVLLIGGGGWYGRGRWF
jgi:hypothetical protein